MLKHLDPCELTDLEIYIEGNLEEMHFTFVKSVIGFTRVEITQGNDEIVPDDV